MQLFGYVLFFYFVKSLQSVCTSTCILIRSNLLCRAYDDIVFVHYRDIQKGMVMQPQSPTLAWSSSGATQPNNSTEAVIWGHAEQFAQASIKDFRYGNASFDF